MRLWQTIKNAWSLYRHAAAFHGLLIQIGVWKYVVLGLVVVAAFGLNMIANLSWFVSILVGLGVFALLLAISGFALALYRVNRPNLQAPAVPNPAQAQGSPSMASTSAAVEMLVHRGSRPPDAPAPQPSLEVRFSDAQPYRFVEAPHFTHYRMGIIDAGTVGADNLCVELL